MYAKALREQQGRISVQIEELIGKAKSEDNRGLSAEEQEKFNKLIDDHSKFDDQIAAAEKGEAIVANSKKPQQSGPAIDNLQIEQIRAEFQMSPAEKRRRDAEKDPRAKAFANYLRSGERTANEHLAVLGIGDRAALDPKNAMSTTSTSQGGALVPTGFSGELEEAKLWFGGIDGVVGKFETGSGNAFPWPTVNDTTNKGRIIGQNVQVAQTDLVFNNVTFNSYIGSSDLVLAPLALLEDSYFDLDGLIARLLGTRIGRLYNQKCTIGTGSGEPTGIVTAAVAAGNVLQLLTGSSASIAYGNLVDLEHLVDPNYREAPSTRWMFPDTMLKLLKKLMDGSNRPLWQPGLTASFQQGASVMTGSKPRILDHEYVINNDMAIPAANAYSMLFGDLSKFKVREVTGGTTVLVLRERYADYLQVGYIAYQRFDSNLIDAGTHPIAVLQQSAT